MQGCIVLTHSYGELNCDQLHNYYNYFHLYHYSLLTSTHKPVLARAPYSISQKRMRYCRTLVLSLARSLYLSLSLSLSVLCVDKYDFTHTMITTNITIANTGWSRYEWAIFEGIVLFFVFHSDCDNEKTSCHVGWNTAAPIIAENR